MSLSALPPRLRDIAARQIREQDRRRPRTPGARKRKQPTGPDTIFLAMVRDAGLPAPTPEHQFHPSRKWRFDYAWPEHRISLEVECGAVGGRNMGSPLAHLNEAAFPEKLAELFVLTYSPQCGVVLDPFCGSGTTLAVALKHGRRGIGIDVRESQVALTGRRIAEADGGEAAA